MNKILDLEEEFKTKRKEEEEWEEEKNRVPRENKKQETRKTDGRNAMKRMGMQARVALAIRFIVGELGIYLTACVTYSDIQYIAF